MKRAILGAVLVLCAYGAAQDKPADTPKDTQQQPAPDTKKQEDAPKHRNVVAPKPIHIEDPEYSKEARKKRIEGTVILWVVVGDDGRVHDVKVSRPLGYGLDEKAVEAAYKWRFEPAKADGKPVSVQVNIEMNFRLNP